MARKKKSESDSTQDQPERDVFDDDEEDTDGPPKLKPGDPGSQDATEKSQDAPGGTPTQVEEKEATQGEEAATDEARAPGDDEKAANESLLEKKGDLQPIPNQVNQNPGTFVDRNSPEFAQAVRAMFQEELRAQHGGSKRVEAAIIGQEATPGKQSTEGVLTFKVARGMVGPFPEGTVVSDIKALGGPEALPRLLESGVIIPFKPETQS